MLLSLVPDAVEAFALLGLALVVGWQTRLLHFVALRYPTGRAG